MPAGVWMMLDQGSALADPFRQSASARRSEAVVRADLDQLYTKRDQLGLWVQAV